MDDKPSLGNHGLGKRTYEEHSSPDQDSMFQIGVIPVEAPGCWVRDPAWKLTCKTLYTCQLCGGDTSLSCDELNQLILAVGSQDRLSGHDPATTILLSKA